jgi:hypothetical protein
MGINELVSDIKKLGESSSTAKLISKSLAGRERMRHETDVNRFKTYLKNRGLKIDDKEYDTYWKDASKLELGSLDRKGRFRWHFNLKTVGQISTGQEPEEHLVKITKKLITEVKRPRGRPANVTKLSNQVGVFFRDKIIFFPMDLSEVEAKRLAEFISKIPSSKVA